MNSFKHHFNPTILREYDIRGIVDKTLFAADLYAVGRAFGTVIAHANGKKAGVCYDGRFSSPEFANQLIRGLNDSGIDVEQYGLGPTAMVYYALQERGLDGAIAITGSHNPPDYNGIKMTLKSGSVYGEAIKALGTLATSGDLVSGKGTVTKIDITEDYLNRLTADYKDHGKKPMKIAWDAGNGVAGAVLKRLTDKIPGEHILLFDDVDGNFPNHHPDPAVEKNLADLKQAVIENNCDLGIAFDGDGDRIGAVDKNGKVIWADQLVALYAREILDRKPGSQIILDVKCSKSVIDLIAQWGGKPLLWKVGHSLAKAKLKETGAPLAGELSGHIFFKDGFYGHDDALYCAVRLLNVINQYGPLDQLANLFPPVFNTPEIRLDVPEEDKFAIVERAKVLLQKNSNVSVLDIDGVRVSTKEGWWLLRASNTQNAITLRAEATSEKGLDDVITSMKDTLSSAGCALPDKLY
jgi:phosphomannomutase